MIFWPAPEIIRLERERVWSMCSEAEPDQGGTQFSTVGTLAE